MAPFSLRMRRITLSARLRLSWFPVVFLALIVVIGLALSACSGGATPRATPPAQEPTSSTVIDATGAELYAANCQVCHGDQQGQEGTGAPSHSQDGHTWHHPDAQLTGWIMNGKIGLMHSSTRIVQRPVGAAAPCSLLHIVRDLAGGVTKKPLQRFSTSGDIRRMCERSCPRMPRPFDESPRPSRP